MIRIQTSCALVYVNTPLEMEQSADASAELLFEMGQVFESRLGDSGNATTCYQRAYQADQGCLKALWASRRLYAEQKDFDIQSTEVQNEAETWVVLCSDTLSLVSDEKGALYNFIEKHGDGSSALATADSAGRLVPGEIETAAEPLLSFGSEQPRLRSWGSADLQDGDYGAFGAYGARRKAS